VPETGLTIANLAACYVRDGADHSASTALTALATVTTAHTDNYAIEIDATACPGLYRIDYPDAAFAAGVARVQLIVTGAAIDPAVIEVELIDVATAAQVASIGSGTGAALNFAADVDNETVAIKTISKVGTQTGTFSNTANDNGVYHVITNAATNIDRVYGFTVGSGRVASKVTFVGYLTVPSPIAGKTVTVSAYNFSTPGWDTVKVINGQTGTTDVTVDVTLLSAHTGTGTEAGKVYIRFAVTGVTGSVLNIDQLVCQAQNLGQTVGYADGAIWIGGANTNTTPYVDGTADNPVTYAAALTLATSTGLTRFRVRNGTTVTLSASAANRSFVGRGWTLALGSQAIDGAYIEGAEVSGTGTCTTQPSFVDCHVNAGTTTGPAKFLRCGFAGSSGSPFTAGSAGEFILVDCYSEVAGSATPYFTFSGACGVNIRRWSGGSFTTLNNATATMTMEVVTGGRQTIATAGASIEIRGVCREVVLSGIAAGATCQIDAVTGPITLGGADGTVRVYGVCGTVTDNRTGTPTLTNDATSQTTVADTTLRRTTANVEASSTGDAISGRSLYGAIARLAHKVSISGSTMTVNRSDDATSLTTASLTTDETADPVTAVDPAA
jgi:hypothetical protein